MKEQLSQKVFDYIDAMAAKLGVAAEHVYGVLVQQMVIEGWVYVMTLPIITVIVITAFVISAKWLSKTHWTENELQLIVTVSTGIASAVLLIITFTEVPTSIMKIYNPEYYAIKEILNAVSGGDS